MTTTIIIETPAGQVKLANAECEVFHMYAEGLTGTEIATKTFRSRKTVATYVDRIRTKLGITSPTKLRVFAAIWCERNKQGSP